MTGGLRPGGLCLVFYMRCFCFRELPSGEACPEVYDQVARCRVELRRYRRVSIATLLNSTQLTQLNSVQPSQSCFCL